MADGLVSIKTGEGTFALNLRSCIKVYVNMT